MALFKISKGSKANLPTALTEGFCWYTYDDSKFYIDHKDENGVLVRKALNAQDAETLTGATLETILNSSDIEIPTSKAVCDAIELAFTQAKESGEFDEVYVGNGDMPEGVTVQILTDGSDAEAELKDDLKEYIDGELAVELAKRSQLSPEFANSIEECTDTSKLYVLPDGYIYSYIMTEVEAGPAYNDLLVGSDGCEMNARLSSSGVTKTDDRANGYFVTPYIPISTTDKGKLLRYRGAELNMTEGAFCIYKSNKTTLIGRLSYDGGSGTGTDENGDKYITLGVGHDSAGEISYDFTEAAYIRLSFTIPSTGIENVIITIDEPMVESTGTVKDYQWANTGHEFIDTPTDDPIVQDIIRDQVSLFQLKPQFANSLDACVDTSQMYVLPDGYIYAYLGIEGDAYVNVLKSDECESNVRLSSSGSTSTSGGSGYFVTPYIPITAEHNGKLLRYRGANLNNANASYVMYKSDKSILGAASYAGGIKQGVDENGDRYITLGYGYASSGEIDYDETQMAFIRLCFAIPANGIENVIITIDEPIVENGGAITDYEWSNTGHAFVPADYEARILQLEQLVLSGSAIHGVVDDNNIITLSGILASGSYTLRYENADGTTTNIGSIIVQ